MIWILTVEQYPPCSPVVSRWCQTVPVYQIHCCLSLGNQSLLILLLFLEDSLSIFNVSTFYVADFYKALKHFFWISIPDNLFLLHLLIPLTDNYMLEKWKLVTRCVRVFGIPWTVAHQVPLFMEFSRQENWSGLPFPPSEDLPNPTMCLMLRNISQAEILLTSCGPLYLMACSLFLPGYFADISPFSSLTNYFPPQDFYHFSCIS